MIEYQHECYIGVIDAMYNAEVVTATELKSYLHPLFCKYSLADYCDWRKGTNLHRFRFCPECGKKIDWKAIKDGADNER